METILSLANTKAATLSPSDEASETPIAKLSAEQFQAVMERMAGNWNQPASPNKTSITHHSSLGAGSSKHSDNRKSSQSKTQTPGSKSSPQATEPAEDSTTASNLPNHLFMHADNPAFLPDNIPGIEFAAVSVKTPATSATASPTKTSTTAKIGKVGEVTNSTPKAGIKSVTLPAEVPAGLPSARLSAAIKMKTAFTNSNLQHLSAANEAKTSTVQTAAQSNAARISTTGKSTVLSKSLQPAEIQIQLDTPVRSIPSTQQAMGTEDEVETSTVRTAAQSNAANIPTTGKSAVLSKSLQAAGIQIQLDTPVRSLPPGKNLAGMHSMPSTQQAMGAEDEVETSTVRTAAQSNAANIPTTGKSTVLSKSLQAAGIPIQLDTPVTPLPTGKRPAGMNSIPSTQPAMGTEDEVETPTVQTAVQSNEASILATGKSAALPKSLQPAGIPIQLDTPVTPLPTGKRPAGMNSMPSTQPPIGAEELQPLALPTRELVSAGSAATTAVPSAVDAFESGIEPLVPAWSKFSNASISETVVEPIAQATAEKNTSIGQTITPASQVPDEPSTGKTSSQKGDGRPGSAPSASGIAVAKTTNSPAAPVLSSQIPSSPAGKNLPPVQLMPVPSATAQTGGQNSATPIPTAHAIAENMVHSSAPQVPMPSALSAGTTVAQQQMPMKMDTKQNEFAGAVEQKLPGKPVLPSPSGNSPAPLAGQPQASGVSAMSVTGATSSVTAEINSASVSNSSPISTSPAHAIQRTQDLMAMQITQMHEIGTDSLRVVIKPDAGLQLSLQLQQHNDGIEVQARVDHGDYNLLNHHWPELQRQFEARGIRVAPLSNGETFFGGGGEGFRQSSHSHGQFSDEEAFPAMAGALSPGYPPTATAKPASASAILSRRWETWA